MRNISLVPYPGVLRAEPVTTKKTYRIRTKDFMIGSSTMPGWRESMEDAHTILCNMSEDPKCSYFAVFDGHGGDIVADYACKYLHTHVVRRQSYKEGNYRRALEEAFVELDEMMMNEPRLRRDIAGSTAVVVIVKDNKLYCANLGDSRSVSYISGRVHPLSFDHKPELPAEHQRIKEAGGTVMENRINDGLAMSRALGDFIYKNNPNKTREEQMVICVPDIIEKAVDPSFEFFVLASDGIWEVMSNERVCNFVKTRVSQNVLPHTICEEILSECLNKAPTMNDVLGLDNMTIIIVVLLKSAAKPYRDLVFLQEPVTNVRIICHPTPP